MPAILPLELHGGDTSGMGKGYAEGPAVEERLAALEQGQSRPTIEPGRSAVYASTEEDSEQHFIGWADEVDADELFASGRAWGIKIVRLTP